MCWQSSVWRLSLRRASMGRGCLDDRTETGVLHLSGQEHDGLRDIDLTIADGECVLFCGRSGCGKTTITRLVNGLIPQFYAGN